jgi:hypothetical protein
VTEVERLLQIRASLATLNFAPLLWFAYLQILDLLSTVAFLMNGVGEANPIVRSLMALGPTPVAGLLWAKLFGVTLAFLCWKTGRTRVLVLANTGYAFLITWNLVALIAGQAGR